MSDTRTDREELARLVYPFWDEWVARGDDEDLTFENERIDAILAAGFARQTTNTFTLTASPARIHEAVDALRDLGVTDTGWEYTDYEAIHHSGFRFVSADGYMPEELRPDVGVDW